MKLDRSVFSCGKLTNNKKESLLYKNFTLKQLFEIFQYLQSVSYNHKLNTPPGFDKTYFKVR